MDSNVSLRLNAFNKITSILEMLSDHDRYLVIRAVGEMYEVEVPRPWITFQ